MKKLKRILAIHDFSGIGKCSLTVALPIISLFGIEASGMPTAVLSTHTGGFEGYTYRDLTNDLPKIADHWKEIDVDFDGIYSGFLGSFKQAEIIIDVIKKLKKNHTKIIVDPVMGDNGELYKIFDKDFPKEMYKVCKEADIIIPNITEAVLMLEEEYIKGPYEESYINNLIKKLSKINNGKVVLTGVFFDENHLGVACYDNETKKIEYIFDNKINEYYHGTGDVFGSYFSGAYIDGKGLIESAKIAVKYTVIAIKKTQQAGSIPKYGVNFEGNVTEFVKDYYNLGV